MEQRFETSLSEICAQLAAHRLPRWHELPDLELYMDQVLALISRYLGGYPGFDAKGLTASMVNNYVKLGVMPPPQKKKYTRTHLAYLLIICLLKASLPIAAIQRLLEATLAAQTEEAVVYDAFCELFEQTDAAVAETALRADAPTGTALPLVGVFRSALRAQAEQALAQKLFDAVLPQDAL